MSTAATSMPPGHKWQGEPLTPAGINGLSATEARVLALLAWHVATRTRVSFTTIGQIIGDNGIALGAAAARSIVNDLHDQGYVRAAAWFSSSADTPLAYFVSGMPRQPHVPRHLRRSDDRVKVGNNLTAPLTLPEELLEDLLATRDLLAQHMAVPTEDRDARWLENHAVYTEARAAAFNQWATIDTSRLIYDEAARLTKAASAIREQAANRRAKEDRQGRANP